MNYFRCASEGATCAIGGTRYMAFGSGNTFVYAYKGGNVSCDEATFGANPAPNKACYFSNYGNYPGAGVFALEGQSKTAFGSVAYGANGAFFFKTIRGDFTCSASTFGDPIPGVSKFCYLAIPQFTLAAREGELMSGLYNTPIAYGANGKFNFRLFQEGPVACDNLNCQCNGNSNTFCNYSRESFKYCNAATFGDPNSGTTNDCYRLVDGHQGMSPAVYLAPEGGTWSSLTVPSVQRFYGSGRNGNLIGQAIPDTSGPCTNSAALGDPDVGTLKHCWVSQNPAGQQGTWSKINAVFPGVAGPDQMQLLMDGSILASERFHNENWYRLRPDPVSGYAGATWSGPFVSHYARAYYGTAMLNDGRYAVFGGEYVTEEPNNVPASTAKCEVFDPIAQTWHDLPDYDNGDLSGCTVAPLPDGRLVVGAGPGGSKIFDSSVCPRGQNCTSNPWSDLEFIGSPNLFAFGEGSITMLQNGNLFAAENRAAKFIPSNSQGSRWSAINDWPSPPPAVWDESLFPTLRHGEAGPLLTLYSGKVFINSATGYNALYDPANDGIVTTAETPGEWSTVQGNFRHAGLFENAQTVLPTGHVLLATTQDFLAYRFFEFNTNFNNFYEVGIGAPDFSAINGNLLTTLLPDGSVLVANAGFKTFYVYKPKGVLSSQYTRPHVTSVSAPVSGIYTLSGTTINGLTNGVNRDDEGHPFTAFPVVVLKRGSSTWYGDVRSMTSMSIAPGVVNTITFALPPGIPSGQLLVSVAASGVLSNNSIPINM